MIAYFYIIKWHDGSGQTSGVVKANGPEQAYKDVVALATKETSDRLYGGVPMQAGDIIEFTPVGEAVGDDDA